MSASTTRVRRAAARGSRRGDRPPGGGVGAGRGDGGHAVSSGSAGRRAAVFRRRPRGPRRSPRRCRRRRARGRARSAGFDGDDLGGVAADRSLARAEVGPAGGDVVLPAVPGAGDEHPAGVERDLAGRAGHGERRGPAPAEGPARCGQWSASAWYSSPTRKIPIERRPTCTTRCSPGASSSAPITATFTGPPRCVPGARRHPRSRRAGPGHRCAARRPGRRRGRRERARG